MGKLNWVLAVITLVFILLSFDFNCEVVVDIDNNLKWRRHWEYEWEQKWDGQCDNYNCDYDHQCWEVYRDQKYNWRIQWKYDDFFYWRNKYEPDGCYPLCVRREDKKLGDTEGHYTAHIGVATNDPCTIPGPEGANYYLKWNHGKLLGAVERPTYKKYTYCFESVIYNQLGYYLWIPPKSVKKGMCVHPSGNYVWYHGPLPKGKQVKGYVAPKTSTLLDFVFPNNNKTMKSIFDLIPPLAEDYTETPKPVTISPQPAPQGRKAVTVSPIYGPNKKTVAPVQAPQGPATVTAAPFQETGPMIIPAPQGPEAVTGAPVQETGPMIIPAPQGHETVTVAPIQETGPMIIPAPQGPEAVAGAPVQETGPMIIPAPQGICDCVVRRLQLRK